jgi:hypothetical protein
MLVRCGEHTHAGARAPGRVVVRGAALALIGLWLGPAVGSRPALADPYSVHAEGAVSLAWTDNTANRSEVGEENQAIPEAGFFAQLRPSVLFTYERKRSVHVSAASVDLNLYATEEPGNTYNGTLVHSSLVALSPVTELGLGATLGFGRADPLSLEQAGQLQGDTTFVSGGLTQNARWQATRDWRFDQSAGFNHVNTDQPGGESVADSLSLSVGADRAWARTSLGLVSSVNYVAIDQNGNDNTQIITNLSANVRRDIDPVWSVAAAAGLGFVAVTEQPDPPNESSFAPTPTGSVTVNYLQPLGLVTASVSASVSHAITPNLLLGNVTNTSSANLTAGVPLPWIWRNQEPVVGIASTLGVAHSRPSLGDGEPNWNTYSANGVVAWAVEDGWTLSLRYQFVRTDVYDDLAMPNVGIQPPEDFFRHTVLLEASGRFPSREAVQMPDRTQRRVDRSNEDPIGGATDDGRGQTRGNRGGNNSGGGNRGDSDDRE